MKVILQADVKALGKKGQVCEVSDGYARNYLFPKRLAVEASAGNMQDLAHRKAADDRRKEHEKQAAQALAAKLDAIVVQMPVKTGEGGRLFGSVTSKEIAIELKNSFGIELDKRKLELKESIKMLGDYVVSAKLHPEVTAQIKVHIVGI